MNRKRRIRYSEFVSRPTPPAVAVVEQPAAEEIVEQRAARVSTPIDLARALAAARRQDDVRAAVIVVESEPYLRMRDRIRARSGIAELLMFRVGTELLAVELLAVDEVIDLPVIHYVPEMPPAMLGVVNVRGSLTPVYTPQQVLGVPLAQRDAVLIFRSGHSRVGVLIDDVEDALTLDLRDLRDAPAMNNGSDVVLGVVRHAGALVAIVDADALIAACQTAVLVETA
ncbi:MAG: chemotaxis protein CheW [Gemmatimonadetes bacterium]|nr:chemotaxis protein CheW [Gemmatimonadota bacterium]